MKKKVFCCFAVFLLMLTCCSCRSSDDVSDLSVYSEAAVSPAVKSRQNGAAASTTATAVGTVANNVPSSTTRTTYAASVEIENHTTDTTTKKKERGKLDLTGYEKKWAAEFGNGFAELTEKFVTDADHMNPGKGSNLSVSEDAEHIAVENGELVLRLTDNGNGTYVAPRSVSTVKKMAFRYGYLEMRAMVPYQEAAWPSFWLKADPDLHKSSSRSEIDIFEVFGSTDTCVPNLHKHLWGQSGTIQISSKGNYKGERKFVFPNKKDLSTQYHTYGFEWTPEYMAFYVDGEWYYKVSIKDEDDYSPDKQPGMDCFHDYHYVCLNNWLMNMRGEYTPEQGGYFPAEYRIDYIRLYQKNDAVSAIKQY